MKTLQLSCHPKDHVHTTRRGVYKKGLYRSRNTYGVSPKTACERRPSATTATELSMRPMRSLKATKTEED